MPFIFNGTTIPENVANAFSFNGVNITDVYFNGVQVWHQSLFNALWSGSALVLSGTFGLGASGSSYRAVNNAVGGNWLTATQAGLAAGTSTAVSSAKTLYLDTTNTTLRHRYNAFTPSGLVSWSLATGFTGSCSDGAPLPSSFITSSKLLAYKLNSGETSPWISLT